MTRDASKSRISKRGKVYYFRFPGASNIQSTRRKNLEEATTVVEGWLHELRVQNGEKGHSEIILREYTGETFFDLDSKYWHKKKKHFSTAWVKIRSGHLKNWILPTFGDVRLCDFSAELINMRFGTMSRRFEKTGELFVPSPPTKNKIFDALNAILTQALIDGLILNNPCSTNERYSDAVLRPKNSFFWHETESLFPQKATVNSLISGRVKLPSIMQS